MKHPYLRCGGLSLAAILMVSAHACAATWTTSADIRERYQFFNNYNFNSAVNNNSWEFDSRLFVKAKGDFGNGLSVLLQPNAVLIRNHTATAGSQYLTQADMIQAYLQYKIGDFGLRLGRQQLAYGDQRLLGRLGWKDVPRTFDGVKAMYRQGDVSLDVFAVHPANIVAMTPTVANHNGRSLVTWANRRLIGAYGTYKLDSSSGIDAYFINWQHNQKASTGKGRNLNTFGVRLFGKADGFDGTAEAVFQTGTWQNNVSQRASAYAVKAGYTFGFWKTRLGVGFNYSPGDDKADPAVHKNFVFPYHTNHAHYGEMDLFSWANMKDIHASLKTSPLEGLSLMGDTHFFWLANAKGDWLNVVGTGNVFAGAPGYTQTRAGTEIDMKVIYTVGAIKGLKLVGLYGVFNPGAAVAERNGGKADQARFGYVFANYKF